MRQGWLREVHTVLLAAVTKAVLTKDTVLWFQGDHVMVDDGSTTYSYDVPLGVHTNKRALAYRPGPFLRFSKDGVELLGTLLRYCKPWKPSNDAVPYMPSPTESKYGVAPRVQLFAETLAKLGGRDALIHDLVDKHTYEPQSIFEAMNLDDVVGAKNEHVLATHDQLCLERMLSEARTKYPAVVK